MPLPPVPSTPSSHPHPVSTLLLLSFLSVFFLCRAHRIPCVSFVQHQRRHLPANTHASEWEKRKKRQNPHHVICRLNTIRFNPIAQYCCRSVHCIKFERTNERWQTLIVHANSFTRRRYSVHPCCEHTEGERENRDPLCRRGLSLGCHYTRTYTSQPFPWINIINFFFFLFY